MNARTLQCFRIDQALASGDSVVLGLLKSSIKLLGLCLALILVYIAAIELNSMAAFFYSRVD